MSRYTLSFTLLSILICLKITGKAQTISLAASLNHENGIMSLTPSDVFINPAHVDNLWMNAPVPLSLYTEDELRNQQTINANAVDAIVTYSPPDNSEWFDFDYDEITPYTWKWVHLDLPKTDGTVTRMSLRRPNWWIKRIGADSIGKKIFMNLEELDAHGWAIVKNITPNQLDTRLWSDQRAGDYVNRPIIGKFVHESNDVYDLYFDSTELVGVTGNHLIWSEERNDWVGAAMLKIGEFVVTHTGKAKLMQREKREGTHTVYNIEVYRSHNYFASANKFLAHNGPVCPQWDPQWSSLRILRSTKWSFEDNYIMAKTSADKNGIRFLIHRADKWIEGGESQEASLRTVLRGIRQMADDLGETSLTVRIRMTRRNKGQLVDNFDFNIQEIKHFVKGNFEDFNVSINEKEGIVDFVWEK